jgi:alpha-beta hydrolase superfamily lysophospholipase
MKAPSTWKPDVLPGFEQTTLIGLSAPDGPVEVVLVRRHRSVAGTRAVLYIHGYGDYFFQTHLADFYNQAGLHFYAVELRRHGRAMRAHQWPNYTADIDEYLQDVDTAVSRLRAEEHIDWLLLNGHSTGGLVTALYAHRGQQRASVSAVFLNSPFLDMNVPAWQQWTLEPILSALGAWFPHLPIPGMSAVYGQCLHASQHGEWHYDTRWKPIAGFPVYAGWLRAIHRAHAEVTQGLAIACPVLVMHASRSAWPKRWSDDVMSTDIVLDVADIRRLSPRLGQQVVVRAIEGGMHDLTLSALKTREVVFNELRDWLMAIGGTQPMVGGLQPNMAD